MSPSPSRDRIHPSPALGVSAHTPIGDCVRLMRDRSVGSLLIMSHQDPGQLVGIFTERDLLKWVDEIQHGGHWEKPVAHLMSKPVVTLPISRFDEAAALMIEKRFRHLPIIYDDPANRGQIAGVISMRDLVPVLSRADAPCAAGHPN